MLNLCDKPKKKLILIFSAIALSLLFFNIINLHPVRSAVDWGGDEGGSCVSSGEPCSSDSECCSGNCVKTSDGTKICCDSWCNSWDCEVCKSDGSGCESKCSANEYCDDGRCVTIGCTQDSDCSAFEYCCTDPSTQDCTWDQQYKCVECTEDYHCEYFDCEECKYGQCVSKCKQDEYCEDGECKSSSSQTDPCANVTCGLCYKCDSNTGNCIPVEDCKQDGCYEGYVCINGQCVNESTTNCASQDKSTNGTGGGTDQGDGFQISFGGGSGQPSTEKELFGNKEKVCPAAISFCNQCLSKYSKDFFSDPKNVNDPCYGAVGYCRITGELCLGGWIGPCPSANPLLGIPIISFPCQCKDENHCYSPLFFFACSTSERKCAEGYKCYEKEGIYGCWQSSTAGNCEAALETAKYVIMSYDTDGDGRISSEEYKNAVNVTAPPLGESDPCECKYKIKPILTEEEQKAIADFYTYNCTYSVMDCQAIASNYGRSVLGKFDTNNDNVISQSEYENAKTLWEKNRIRKNHTGPIPQPSGRTFCFFADPGTEVKVYTKSGMESGEGPVSEATTSEMRCAEIKLDPDDPYGIYIIKAGDKEFTHRVCDYESSGCGLNPCVCTCDTFILAHAVTMAHVPTDEEMAILTAAMSQGCNLVTGEKGCGGNGGGNGGDNGTKPKPRPKPPSCSISADPQRLIGYGEVSITTEYKNFNGSIDLIMDCGTGIFTENQEKTIVMGDSEYKVMVLAVNSPTTATISIDGNSYEVEEKNLYDFSGLKVHVDDINEESVARKAYVKMFFGSQKNTKEKIECSGESCETVCYFAYGGNYTITGSIDNIHCSSAEVYVEPLGDPPVADFTYYPPNPKPEEIITFDANSSYDPDGDRLQRYLWDFDGDGFFEENTTSAVITHSFSTPGYKNVSLKVVDVENQESSIVTKSLYASIPVTLRIVSVHDEGNGQRVTFSVDIPYDIVEVDGVTFDFGDGSDTMFFDHKPDEVYHLYEAEGNYTASVIVWFADGGESSDNQTVIIFPGLRPPEVSFTYSPELPIAGQYIYFTVTAHDPDGGDIVSYRWDYGENNIFTTTSADLTSYSYSIPGNYVVTLTVTDDDGQTNSFSRVINVMPPSVSFEVSDIVSKEGETDVTFSINIPSGSEVNFMEMSFGDETEPFYADGYVDTIEHTYRNSGVYDVSLTVQFTTGAVSTYVENITVEIFSEGVSVLIKDKGAYKPGEEITGDIEISYYRIIPRNSTLVGYIDGEKKSEVSMYNYLFDENYYEYTEPEFKYRITAYGENRWIKHTEQTFSYTVKASGTETEEKIPWSAEYSSEGVVNSADGLKFIYDVSESITLPNDANDDTVWEVIENNNSNVALTMREACGNDVYNAYVTNKNGWVERIIDQSEFIGIPGTSNKEAYIEKFDGDSLLSSYFGERGGIYKNDVYQKYGSQVLWEGNRNGQGYVKIINYDNNAIYKIRYLPPMGSKLCAYTSAVIQNSTPWERSAVISGTVSHELGYEKTYTEAQLTSLLTLPSCPSGSSDCEQKINRYEVVEVYDPLNSVVIGSNYDSNKKELYVHASSINPRLSKTYTASVSLSEFGLSAPETLGEHKISFKILSKGNVIASGEKKITVCNDNDGDGFCAEQGDLDDNDVTVYPGAPEICDGKDNDCDGQIDEDFIGTMKNLGEPCGVGACSGVYVCNENGTDVVCSNTLQPGEQPEICDNNIDDDCDGITDEEYEVRNGKQVEACVCREGDKKPCGKDIGECRRGYQECKNGKWGPCVGGKGPSTEICNGLDDDCNGIVDDIFNSVDLSITHCACSGKTEDEASNIKLTSTEICNDIDDDCDGKIDEGLSCCTTGDTRPCVNMKGICAKGIQRCEAGSWGQCSIQPQTEICGNKLDDDCDGKVDEKECVAREGGDESLWIIVAGVGAAIIIATTAGVMMGKI